VPNHGNVVTDEEFRQHDVAIQKKMLQKENANGAVSESNK